MTLDEIISTAKESQTDSEDLIELIWKQSLTVKEKIVLSFRLFDRFPTAYVLMELWVNYRVTGNVNRELTNIIFQKYQEDLSKPTSNVHEAMEHSLFFDIFQSPELQSAAWDYFLENQPNEDFFKIMLANAAPMPYWIKDKLYQALIPDTRFHVAIYKSIRDSCTYSRGYVVDLDKTQALKTVTKLDIGEAVSQLDKEKGRETYSQILLFLSTQNGR
jgi:hypothetical protein